MIEKQKTKKRTYTIVFPLVGIGFGLLFPIIATLIELLIYRIPIAPSSIWNLHITEPLLWIIDTAPFFLGLFAYFIGVRQDYLLRANEELQLRDTELKTTQSTIEQRIEAQTQEIFLNSKKLEAVAQVARDASSIHDLGKLLDEVVHLTGKQFGFYHVGIFLLDDTGKTAILQAANSEGGKRMLARGHQLQVGAVGIVGHVAGTGKTRIALDVGGDAVFFQNPDLPETRSEMALPLKVREKVIGVFDLQSTQQRAFLQKDVDILQILADQVAIAIDNARLLLQSQAVIQQLQTITGEQARKVWKEKTQDQSHGFIYTPLGFKPLSGQKRLEEIIQPDAGHQLAIPILLRGQEIGRIKLQRNASQPTWGKKEQILAGEISNQVALALENARLITDAQERAERERLLGEISTKIGASSQRETILRTAVEELGRVLPGSEVIIQFQNRAERVGKVKKKQL